MGILTNTLYTLFGIKSMLGIFGSIAEFIADDVKIAVEEKLNGKKDS